MDPFQPFPPEDALPPEEVRFTELRVEPWPDGHRVRVHMEITPFQKRPNVDAQIVDAQGNEVTSVAIVETMDNRIVFTMHLRDATVGPFLLKATLSYEDLGLVNEDTVEFNVEEPPQSE